MRTTLDRRHFLAGTAAGVLGAGLIGCSSISPAAKAVNSPPAPSGSSRVGFAAGTDSREAAYRALKPFASEVENAIGDKQVVIKANVGQVRPDWWLNATDADQMRGILDFLAEIHDRPVIIAESTATWEATTYAGFRNFGYFDLSREYNVTFLDLNERPAVQVYMNDDMYHPKQVGMIDMFLDPDIYMISATRLKTHDRVIATLGFKNICLGAPKNHYSLPGGNRINEKPAMHVGDGSLRHKVLTMNMFQAAQLGIVPDLTVLDGVVGMEGNGPVHGTPVEQGVALAGTDWVAVDRLGVELMGVDYTYIKYLQWSAEAGLGEDDLSSIEVIGPDFRPHIVRYQMHERIDEEKEWVEMDGGV